MILFSEVDQVLQEPFVKQNVHNSSFHVAPGIYCTIKFPILPRYTSVATTRTKVVLFERGLPIILWRKYLSFFIVNYLNSSQVEVNLPLYRDIYKKPNKLQRMIKRQIKDLSTHKGNCM